MKDEASSITKSSTWAGSEGSARKPRLQRQHSFPLEQTRHVYRNLTTTGNATQINGNLGDRGARIEKPRYYEGLVAGSSSLQINGNVYTDSDNFEAVLSSNRMKG